MKLALVSLISLCVLLGPATASPVLGETGFIARDDLEDDSVNIISSQVNKGREEEDTDSFNFISHYNTVPARREDGSVDVISRDDTIDNIFVGTNY